jgi:hypothetical protein
MDHREHIQLLETHKTKSYSEIYCKVGCLSILIVIIFIIVAAVKLK